MESVPKEILICILGYLPYEDLKRSRLVCQRFLDAASERKLWRQFILRISQRNLSSLRNIFELNIFKDLQKVIFTGCAMKNEHVKIILEKEIKYIQVGSNHDIENDCDMSKVSPKNLASLTMQLKEMKYHNSLMTEMTQKQMISILAQLNKASNITRLEFFFNNHLTSIVPEKLASALTSVTELTLVFQKLNADKYDAIFYHIYKTKTTLKVLNLPGNNLSKANPDLFGSAITRLQSANLSDTNISPEMFGNMFMKMTRTGVRTLTHLDIAHNSRLKLICPSLLAEALNTLEAVSLKKCGLTEEQVTSLMETRIISDSSQLVEVDLSCHSSLYKIMPGIIKLFIKKLTSATLYATKLNPIQLEVIMDLLARERHSLKFLDIGGSNLSSISPSLISTSVNKIESVILHFCKLTASQQTEILLKACRGTKLKYLDISGNGTNVSIGLLNNAQREIRTLKHDIFSQELEK